MVPIVTPPVKVVGPDALNVPLVGLVAPDAPIDIDWALIWVAPTVVLINDVAVTEPEAPGDALTPNDVT